MKPEERVEIIKKIMHHISEVYVELPDAKEEVRENFKGLDAEKFLPQLVVYYGYDLNQIKTCVQDLVNARYLKLNDNFLSLTEEGKSTSFYLKVLREQLDERKKANEWQEKRLKIINYLNKLDIESIRNFFNQSTLQTKSMIERNLDIYFDSLKEFEKMKEQIWQKIGEKSNETR